MESHKAKDKIASGTKGMGHASRSIRSNGEEDLKPLTQAEFQAHRQKEEAENRAHLKKLRDEWEIHAQFVRMAEAKPKEPLAD